MTPGTVLELPTAQLIARGAPEAEAPPAQQGTTSPQQHETHVAPRPRPAPRSRPAPGPVAEPEPPPPAPPPAPAPEQQVHAAAAETGTLRVQTRPWSKVLVDGRMVGTTPLMNVPLSAGAHTLTFVNDDFGIHKTVKVQIEPGQTLTQVLTLTD